MTLMIYLISMVDNVRDFLMILCILSGVAIGLYGFGVVMTENCYDRDERAAGFKKLLTKCAILIVVLGSVRALIPSSQGLAAMVIVPTVVNNEKVQGITENTLTLLQNLTAKWAKDVVNTTTDHEEKK